MPKIEGATFLGFNLEIREDAPHRIDPNNPFVYFAFADKTESTVMSDTNDLSNTTVKILKKISAPSGGGKFVVKVTATEEGGETVYTADKTVAECIAANEAGQVVEADGDGVKLLLTSAENGRVLFQGAMYFETSIIAVAVAGEAQGDTDSWSFTLNNYSILDRLVVTLTKTGTGSEAVYSGDKSYSEIKAALDEKRDVEVLYPYDLTGVSTDPIFLHLYPIGYLEANQTISFSSVPTFFGDVLFTVAASCNYESDATRWIIAQTEIAEKKEFAFTATTDGQGGKTITPASGVTYSAVLDAWKNNAEIIFRISEGTDVTKFHVKSYVTSAQTRYFDCTELAYLGTNGWAGVFLTFNENSVATMHIHQSCGKTNTGAFDCHTSRNGSVLIERL